MQYDKQIQISVANTRHGPWQVQQYALSQFYAKLSQPARGQECRAAYLALPKRDQDRLKDVGGFVAGALKDGVRRSGHVLSRSLITLDVDKLEPGGANRVLRICESLGCGYAVYSTRKHAPEAPRLRLILPLADDLTADEYEPAARYAAQIIDPTMQMFDRTTFQAERLMYWPSCCSDGGYVFFYADRPPVDARALLARDNWRDVTRWPRCPDEAAAVQRTAAKQQDPTTKEGVVGAFCRVYDVYSAMDKFIPGVYESVDNASDRFTFTGGSTAGGAVVYENGKFLYSHHATDPAGGQLCNAFDLVRLHKFADQDDSAKPGTPTAKLPSWQAMCKLAEADPAVHDQKVSDRAEQIKRDFADQIAASQAVTVAPALYVQAPQPVVAPPAAVASPAPQQAPAAAPVEDVAVRLAELLEDSKSKITSPLVEAAMDAMGIRIGRNEITGRMVISGLPAHFSAEEAANTAPVLISDFLRQNDINAAPDSVAQYIGVIADKYRFNPVRDWLLAGSWDGFDRWPMIYEILGIEGDENRKYHTYVRKWFLQAVALAMNDPREPRSADGALVLQGPQGCGKTLFFRKMVPCRDWFKEGVSIDLANKDTVINATGGWITELGELDSTLKREQIALKAFITAERDEIRAPYARTSTNRLRRTCFCGTVNPEGFLRDETGSRRFWVVPVTQISVQQLLSISTEAVSQVWYQAYREWRENEDGYRLSGSERAGLEHDNAQFEASVQWQEELEDLMDWSIPDEDRQEVSAAWLARNVLRNGASARAVGKALGAIAKVHGNVVYVRKSSSRTWLLPIKKSLAVMYGA